MGLFTLVACSDESYQDADKLNEVNAVENSGSQNSIKTVDPTIPYQSPFNLNVGGNPIEYVIINNTDLNFSYQALVGLARYDGAEDDKHFSWSLLPASDYRTIFGYEVFEYLNIIPTRDKIILSNSSETSGVGPQLPIVTTGFFSFDPGLGVTPVEESLLHEYGKVYAFHVGIFDPVTNTISPGYTIKVPFLPQGITNPNQVSSEWKLLPSSPNNMDVDFWYNVKTREICSGSDPTYNSVHLDLNIQSSQYILITGHKKYKIECVINASQVVLTMDEI